MTWGGGGVLGYWQCAHRGSPRAGEEQGVSRGIMSCGVPNGCLGESDKSPRALHRHQGPACTAGVLANGAWVVTANCFPDISLAGRSGEIQLTLSKHSHITEHCVWRVHDTNCFHLHISQSSKQLYGGKGWEGPGSLFFREQRVWRVGSRHELAWARSYGQKTAEIRFKPRSSG